MGKMIELKDAEYDDVVSLSSMAGKAGVSLKKTSDTKWWVLLVDGQLAGCSAVIYKSGIYRMKGSYILEEFRGLGAFNMINQERIRWCIEQSASMIEAYTFHPSIFVKLGFSRGPKKLSGRAHHFVLFL